ncbi:serine hydrolase [Nostoc ellipsosporum NOK]|nr:serine hydrolase [Nostoc ellipsosporum NOK]
MLANPQYFDFVLRNADTLEVQVIYTQINRDEKGAAHFTNHFFHVREDRYFYPASTVKLPIAVLALQRLHELHIDPETAMITEAAGEGQTVVYNDPSTPNGPPTVAQYIRKILLVSDNDAYNRLYEFLGSDYINSQLQARGYAHARILHRLESSIRQDYTNPVAFVDTSGKTLYEQPARYATNWQSGPSIFRGNGFMKDGKLVAAPFDFGAKNRLTLPELHDIMRSILFPADVPAKQRFNLREEDYTFLRRYMSMYPREAGYPPYDSLTYPDTYVKNWLYGAQGNTMPGVRIFNKTGTAYGYLLDIAYIKDEEKGVEFMLSGVMYCNSDGILNDNKYDYKTIGYPFFRELGKLVYEYEKQRPRKHR